MIQELKPPNAQPDEFVEDEASEEIVNDSLGTIDIADTTGLASDDGTEDEEIGYATDERQD
jgi:hypothetical protein